MSIGRLQLQLLRRTSPCGAVRAHRPHSPRTFLAMGGRGSKSARCTPTAAEELANNNAKLAATKSSYETEFLMSQCVSRHTCIKVCFSFVPFQLYNELRCTRASAHAHSSSMEQTSCAWLCGCADAQVPVPAFWATGQSFRRLYGGDGHPR